MKREKDPDRREVMKKFTIKSVLDNFRTSMAQPQRPDQEIQETLRPENFQVKRTFRHGFPYQPTAMAFDPVQRLLAIGSKCGSLRILGQPGVDIHVRHDMDGPPGSAAVILLQFLVNEGALVSATADDSLHLWNFRQKVPQIVQSLKFQKEKITCMHLPLQSKWLYVGTEKGNIHVVHIESFLLSGYIINWNKTIEVSRKTRPGAIVHLSDNPLDANKLLIGYDSGLIVLWDLKNKLADMRWQTNELRSITWYYDGKQFMCSHTDGTLTIWNIKSNLKYIQIIQPHGKLNKDGKLEQCKKINKVEWKTTKNGESYIIFCGGMPNDQNGRIPSITVIYNKITTVLEMEHNVIDFITLCESPYPNELQEPYAIIALLQNDLVVMDLQTNGFPCLENPYPMDIHESSVTCCFYIADCPAELIPAFYSVGRAGSIKKNDFSEMDWPIRGGIWSGTSCSYNEIIITGHSDGSIKFWDASAGTLQVLYKLKTAKVFEKFKSKSIDCDDEPLAIQLISFCPESRKLCIAGASSYVILFTFKKTESNDEITVLQIPIIYEMTDEGEVSPDCQFVNSKLDMFDSEKDNNLKVRSGPQKKPPGFQAQLVCLTPWNNGEPPSHITSLAINSSYGLMAYGNEAGLVVIDIEQKVCLLNVGSPDLYGAQDPYSRVPRSPKKNAGSDTMDERRSPSIDQMGRSLESPYSLCPCPTTPIEQAFEAVEEEKFVPISSNHRKSWKAFKRQLSKVDIKIKNTLKEKRNSIFYDISPSQIESDDDNDNDNDDDDDDDDNDNDESDENTIVDNQSVIDLKSNQSPTYEEYPLDIQFSPDEESDSNPLSSSSGQYENIKKNVSFLNNRPNNLELISDNDNPIPPPRKKKINYKRNQRLLSVPNIKFQKPEIQNFKDLREENIVISPQSSFTGNLMRRFKPTVLIPTLWVGTSLGSVLTILITPPDPDSRSSQPVVVSLVGVTIFRLKGAILSISFLDCNGSLIPYTYELWKDDNKREKTPTKSQNRMSPTFNENRSGESSFQDRQFVVIASEKQARVVALPSQTCLYRQQLTENDFVVKAEVISLRDSVCLVCYISNGHLAAYSLPSLRPLIDIDFLPLSELSFQTQSNKGIVDPMLSIWGQQLIVNEDTGQISRTFCFSNRGHGLYLASPTELQKFTLCTEFCSNLTEMIGELFLPLDMPEPPKEGFFKGLFGGGVRNIDREELFGESSGKANKSVAKHIPGNMGEISGRVTSTCSEINKAHKMVLERGEKLNQLEERAERMSSEAEKFGHSAHELMLKYRDKKWYQL